MDYGGSDFRKMMVFSDFYCVLLCGIMIEGLGNYFFGERRFLTNVTTIFNDETGGWD